MKSFGSAVLGATIAASLTAAFGWYGGKVFIGLAVAGICVCLTMVGFWGKRRHDEFEEMKKRLGRVERRLRDSKRKKKVQ
jgi:hypothetical protein